MDPFNAPRVLRVLVCRAPICTDEEGFARSSSPLKAVVSRPHSPDFAIPWPLPQPPEVTIDDLRTRRIMLVVARRYLYLGTGFGLFWLFWYILRSPLAQATGLVSPPKPASVSPPTQTARNATLGVRIFLLSRISIQSGANCPVII